MDPECSLQDVVRCHLCETPEPPLHCDVCDNHVCKDCEEKHCSEESKIHKMVPFKFRRCITKCQKHSSELCERYCEQCKITVCEQCVSSEDHGGHEFVDVVKKLENQKLVLQRDLTQLRKSICPKYQDIVSIISVQKADLKENSEKLATAIHKHGEDLKVQITFAVKALESDLDKMESECMTVLNKEEDEIINTISEITQSIDEMNRLLISNDVSLLSAYKSRNSEFDELPPKLTVTFPSFIPNMNINNDWQINEHFGSLSMLSIKTEKHDSTGNTSHPPERPFIDVPRVITVIDTEYGKGELKFVSCLNDEQIWTCGSYATMRLYNLQGRLIWSIHTKSRNRPTDIAVTRSGDLVYTDHDRTVNIVKNGEIQRMIRLQEWRPSGICSTSSGDLLVVMNIVSDTDKQTKVVRYSGSTEKQSIQYDDNGQPLYSSEGCILSENRNLDICVCTSNALVVVNHAGKLRFTYTGPPSTTKESIAPEGITTDSQSRILAAYFNNNIHILDQDGQFLRYIDMGKCKIDHPYGLCVDTKDNLFVVYWDKAKINKIQYYM